MSDGDGLTKRQNVGIATRAQCEAGLTGLVQEVQHPVRPREVVNRRGPVPGLGRYQQAVGKLASFAVVVGRFQRKGSCLNQAWSVGRRRKHTQQGQWVHAARQTDNKDPVSALFKYAVNGLDGRTGHSGDGMELPASSRWGTIKQEL